MEPVHDVQENPKEAVAIVGGNELGERTESKKSGISLVASGVGLLYFVLLLWSAWYMLDFEKTAVMKESQDDNDTRVAEAAQLIEEVPRCMTNCIFPLLIPETCTHTDYRCVCTNLRSLDDPPPSSRENKTIPPYRYTSQFATCVNDTCSLLEQIRAPGYIHNLCHTFGVPVEFPEVMVPFYKRAGLDARDTSAISGSAFAGQPPEASTVTSSGSIEVSTLTLPAVTTTAVSKTATASGISSSFTSSVNTFSSFQTTSSGGAPSPTNTGGGDNKKSGGISASAKIDIGVSIPLAVLLFLVGAFWYFRRRSRKRATPDIHDIDTIPEKYSESRQVIEADGEQINEMGNTSSVTRASVYEMPSQTTGAASPPSSPPSISRKPISPRTELVGNKAPNTSIVSPSENSTELESKIVGSNTNPLPDTIARPRASSSRLAPPQQDPATTTGMHDNEELVKLEREMAQLQRRKERLQEEKELERREDELRKIIEDRKKAMGTSSDRGDGAA